MPAKTTITNRKRSAEICPHPPHLLNKRYWEDKTGKDRISKSGIQNICTKAEIPVKDKSRVESSPIKKHFELSFPPSKNKTNSLDINLLTNNLTTISNTSDTILKNNQKINYNQNNIFQSSNIPPFLSSLQSSFPFRFPIPSNELQSLSNFEELMRVEPSQFNFQMFQPPPPPSFYFPPMPPHFGSFSRPMFHQEGTSTGIMHPSTFSTSQQFPQILNEKQNIEECKALTQLMEIFNKNQAAKESMSYNQQQSHSTKCISGNNKEHKIKSCISDDQIDKMLDEMIKDREKKLKGQNSPNDKRLCILPLPVPIPIIVPLSNDFILKYFATKRN